MDTAILNDCLTLAMEWGPDWIKPTQARMRTLYPHLTETELNQYDSLARTAMHTGFNVLYDEPRSTYEQCLAAVTAKYPWVSQSNLERIYSQGLYYAHK